MRSLCPPLLAVLAALSRLRPARPCDPCASVARASVFKARPRTGCKEYVQCIDGRSVGDFRCSGDTVYDERRQYCNWPSSVVCSEAACPPTGVPVTGRPTEVEGNCPNPCPAGFAGYRTRPGSRCKKYVSCLNGDVAVELECFGDTIFNLEKGYCDWMHSYTCGPAPCPEGRVTPVPAPMPAGPALPAPVGQGPPSPVAPQGPLLPVGQGPAGLDSANESSDCPNPCPAGFNGFKIRPGSRCKEYVSCVNGDVAVEMQCYGDTLFNPTAGYCDWPRSTSCGATPCPWPVKISTKPDPTPLSTPGPTPPLTPDPTLPPTPDSTPPPVAVISISIPEPVEIPIFGPEPMERASPGPEFYLRTALPTGRPTARPTPRPAQTRRTAPPTPPPPTPFPTTTYQNLRSYLMEREDVLNSIVFQSNQEGRSPSTLYTLPDLLDSLDVAVFQFPQDKAFFVGEGVDGRLPKLSGLEYGLINLAAFLSNAMEEGIRIDSCNEWNTDFIDSSKEKYPLSNACGQYGRSYEDEECQETEPFHCPVDKRMEITAVDGNRDVNAPPFTCAATMFDDGKQIFPGYYDSVVDMVIPSAYANTLGRTDTEGCCWWGRGVLLTRGRCALGKLDKYVGQGATGRGVYVYPDIDFCADPGAICNHERSNELRWVLGMLEWTDRVQSYVDPSTGWSYLNQLREFVDGGMWDDSFINSAVGILARRCHDDSCADRWRLDEGNGIADATRRHNFRRIVFEAFNLPMTYRPTKAPVRSPSFSPTLVPTLSPQPSSGPTRTPTDRPTRRKRKKKSVEALPPSSARSWRIYHGWLLSVLVSLLLT